jgi:hypothetical protein
LVPLALDIVSLWGYLDCNQSVFEDCPAFVVVVLISW